MEKDRSYVGKGFEANYERKNKMINDNDKTMVSFEVSSQILDTIDDIRFVEGQASRSSVFRKLVNSGLKNYYQILENNKIKSENS